MNFKLFLQNEKGEEVCFTDSSNQYMVSSITGLDEPTATITRKNYSGLSGSYVTNRVIPTRNIVINFKMTGNNIETNRQNLYKVVKTSQYIKLIYKTRNVDVWTEGYAETCTISNFQALTTGQVSIICPNPYWFSSQKSTSEISKLAKLFEFPFSIASAGIAFSQIASSSKSKIVNDGEDTGFIITMKADGVVNNPKICNIDTDEAMGFTDLVLDSGDILIINTRLMEKSIIHIKDGVQINVISKLKSDSTWLTCRQGTSEFQVLANSGVGNLSTELAWQTSYLGV